MKRRFRKSWRFLRAGYLYRYGVSSGDEADPRFKGKVYQLEQEIAAMSRVRYAVAVNSGTSALLTAMVALGIGPGDEVIVPGFTFVASISSIVYTGAVPVLAEIDRTFNLDPVDVRAKITPRTRAIMVVHMMGNPARLDELKAIADDHDLHLIEDCCQAVRRFLPGTPHRFHRQRGRVQLQHLQDDYVGRRRHGDHRRRGPLQASLRLS